MVLLEGRGGARWVSAAPVLRRQAFHDALGRPPPDEDMAALNKNLLAEVRAVRRAMRAPTIAAGSVEERPSKLSRTSSGLDHTDKAKTLSIELASATKTALRNVPDTIARATRLCLLLRQGEGATDEDDHDAVVAAATAYQQMCSRQALAAHTLVVADALQLLLSARLAAARGNTLHGVGIASDETPPRGKRFFRATDFKSRSSTCLSFRPSIIGSCPNTTCARP